MVNGMLKKSILTLAILSQSVMAVENIYSEEFDKKIVNFGPVADIAQLTKDSKKPSYFLLTSKSEQSAIFEAQLTTLSLAKVKMADGNVYNRILLPDAGSSAQPGHPNLTGYRQMVRIPDGVQLELVIDNVIWSESFPDMTVEPVQLPIPDVVTADGERPGQHMPFVKDETVYNLATDAIEEPIRIIETVRVRGKNYAVISYRPTDFNSIDKSVRFATKVKFHLNFVYSDSVGSKPKRHDPLQPNSSDKGSTIDLRTDRDFAVDAVSAPDTVKNDAALTPAQAADYLIITADRFQEAVAPLAAWKRKMGYKVHVAPILETGSTQEEIKEYIKDAYQNGTMTSYVLLVGDHEDVPSWEVIGHPYHGQDHVWHTDFDYSLVDGTDALPDLVIGRFSGDTVEQITTMVNRTLNYAKSPVDSDRYGHVLLAGQFQDHNRDNKGDRMFMEDLQRIADFLGPDFDFFAGLGDLFNKGYTVHTALKWDADLNNELKYGGWAYGSARITPPTIVPQAWKDQGSGDRVQIAEAINDGVGLVVHRDHGYAGGSGWADPEFTSGDVNGLTNGDFAPVVFSLNCATGWFDGKDTFAESWMRNANGGAVGFTGAARVSYSGYNDNFHVGIMDSFWDDYDGTWSSDIYPVSWQPAMALNRAKERLYSHYGQAGYAKMTARFFNWLGDPSMEMRTVRPQSLTVTHPANLSAGNESSFSVVVRSGDVLLEGARVALVTTSGESHVAETDNNGRATFEFTPNKTMSVTVTEHDAIPYEGKIVIASEGPKAVIQHNEVINAGSWFYLDGRESVVAKGVLRYQWTQISGQKVVINQANDSRAWVNTSDSISQDETLVFKLMVTDESDKSAFTTHSVLIKASAKTKVEDNKAPVARVEADQKISVRTWAVLDGRKSTDADGSIVSYQWTQVSGPTVRIIRPTGRYAYALTSQDTATLTFKLTVTDNKGMTDSAIHTIVVNDPNAIVKPIPVANVAPVALIRGTAQKAISLGKWTNLDGRQSRDADGSIVSYQWTQVSGPKIIIDRPNGNNTYVIAPYKTGYVKVKLTVTDNKGKSGSTIITLMVNDSNVTANQSSKDDNLAPVAHAGEDKQASYRQWVVLDGRKSTDADGSIVSYQWTQVAGEKVRIDHANKNYAYAVTPMADATLKFQLTVTDDKGKTSSSISTVVVSKGN